MGEKRVFEGRAKENHDGYEWWSLDQDGDESCDAGWLEGLGGRRVRITVEELDDETKPMSPRQDWVCNNGHYRASASRDIDMFHRCPKCLMMCALVEVPNAPKDGGQ